MVIIVAPGTQFELQAIWHPRAYKDMRIINNSKTDFFEWSKLYIYTVFLQPSKSPIMLLCFKKRHSCSFVMPDGFSLFSSFLWEKSLQVNESKQWKICQHDRLQRNMHVSLNDITDSFLNKGMKDWICVTVWQIFSQSQACPKVLLWDSSKLSPCYKSSKTSQVI